MKNAKNMKVLYQFYENESARISTVNDFAEESKSMNDSMEFRDSSGPATKKLRMMDVLIDLKISIKKIEREVILSEDGRPFTLLPALEAPTSSLYHHSSQSLNDSHSQASVHHSSLSPGDSLGIAKI